MYNFAWITSEIRFHRKLDSLKICLMDISVFNLVFKGINKTLLFGEDMIIKQGAINICQFYISL